MEGECSTPTYVTQTTCMTHVWQDGKLYGEFFQKKFLTSSSTEGNFERLTSSEESFPNTQNILSPFPILLFRFSTSLPPSPLAPSCPILILSESIHANHNEETTWQFLLQSSFCSLMTAERWKCIFWRIPATLGILLLWNKKILKF